MAYMMDLKLPHITYYENDFRGVKPTLNTEADDTTRDRAVSLMYLFFLNKKGFESEYTPTNEIEHLDPICALLLFIDDECRPLLSYVSITFSLFNANGQHSAFTDSLQQFLSTGKNNWGFALYVHAIPVESHPFRFTTAN